MKRFTVVLILVFCAPATAQDSLWIQVRDLNRGGAWSEASVLAERFLASDRVASSSERCRLIFGLAYARTRLGEIHAAKSALERFDRECASVELVSWVRREASRIRDEITGSDLVPEEQRDSAAAEPAAMRPREVAAKPDETAPADQFWETVDPAAVGLNTTAIEAHRDLCERTGADACLLVYAGRIVQEWYSPRYREPMMAMSTTKSITGLLVGMLIDDGRIPGLDQRVCAYITEWCDGRRGRVTLRHLLTMTAGLPRMRQGSVGFVSDKNAYVIGLEPTSEPGTRWAYSNEGVQLLSPILDVAAGEPIEDYARERLFEPIGMSETRMHLGSQGNAWTYAGLETTPRDLARIGLLLLNGGMWQGRRIISDEWIDASTRPSQSLNPEYGLLWWLHEDPRGYAGHGHLDTHLHISPGLDLIAVRMQSRPKEGIPEGTYERAALPLFERMVR